jgi:hypothetical protein
MAFLWHPMNLCAHKGLPKLQLSKSFPNSGQTDALIVIHGYLFPSEDPNKQEPLNFSYYVCNKWHEDSS